MLSLQHVTVSLGKRTVLRDVSLDVEPKDTVVVLGDEGNGKSTLLKLLTRELQPDEGVLKIDGANLAQLPREVLRMYRERIGYLGEDTVLDDSLSIARNVGAVLDLRGVPAAERDRAVADLLKRFHLTGVANERPSRVSRGERRLAAIARAIATGPMIVIFDEPFSGLSDEAAGIAASLLQNMQKKGATLFIASAEARTAGFFKKPRIVRLQRGKLTEDAASPETTHARVREISQTATADLVERSETAAVGPADPETAEHAKSAGKKKVHITAVGSL